jgi:hypothetical protein
LRIPTRCGRCLFISLCCRSFDSGVALKGFRILSRFQLGGAQSAESTRNGIHRERAREN